MLTRSELLVKAAGKGYADLANSIANIGCGITSLMNGLFRGRDSFIRDKRATWQKKAFLCSQYGG